MIGSISTKKVSGARCEQMTYSFAVSVRQISQSSKQQFFIKMLQNQMMVGKM